jgi:putative transposase
MLKSWRRNYIKGERSREKPVVKRKFVRIKETLYCFKDGKIKVNIRPHEEYLEFDVSKAWFLSRAKGELGELILGEKYLTVTFRFKADEGEVKGKMAWDCNEKSLDGFSPNTGWIRIDLTRLFHIHRVYETKRKRLQQKASKKPRLEGFWQNTPSVRRIGLKTTFINSQPPWRRGSKATSTASNTWRRKECLTAQMSITGTSQRAAGRQS